MLVLCKSEKSSEKAKKFVTNRIFLHIYIEAFVKGMQVFLKESDSDGLLKVTNGIKL